MMIFISTYETVNLVCLLLSFNYFDTQMTKHTLLELPRLDFVGNYLHFLQ